MVAEPFSAGRLQPRGGAIRAMIFSNPLMDVPEGVYWGIEIDFDPLTYRGELLDYVSMSCDFLTIPARDWKQLEGVRLEGSYDQIEASFYVYEHDYANYSRIAIDERDGVTFRVRYDMSVQFSGLSTDDEDPDLLVSADVVIPYNGLLIHSSIVAPLPENIEQARSVAARYVDLDTYEAPRLEVGAYVLKPTL